MYGDGSVIARLKPGDEIIIKVGFGYPAIDKDSTHIVAAVDGFSALTTSGITLSCHDGLGVKPTGKHYDEFTISPRAREILGAKI